MTKTWRAVRRPPRAAMVGLSHPSGRASARPIRKISRQRQARRSHCSNFKRRRFFRMAWRRYSMAAQWTTLNRRRLRMWMMIGMDARRVPATANQGEMKKAASIMSKVECQKSNVLTADCPLPTADLFDGGGAGGEEAAQ